jgi:hypothetical protein
MDADKAEMIVGSVILAILLVWLVVVLYQTRDD